MQKTKAQLLKAQRGRKQRKDFRFKRNVNRNRRSETYEVKRDIFGPARDDNNEILTNLAGEEIIVKLRTRTIIKKRKVDTGLPMPYPQSRKITKAKEKI